MRIFRGLENVHAVIDQHEAEWRQENGEEPLQPTPRVRARVVERYSKPLPQEGEKAKFDPERFSQGAEPQVKAINVIEQGDGEHHSWLYKEVMKAINDAAAGNKNTKIVAVFVPVIQNSKEFDNFPADETLTLSSAVNEEDVHQVKPEKIEPEINTANIVEDLLPPTQIEADSELTEAFLTIEENLDIKPEPEPVNSGLMMEAPDDNNNNPEVEEESGELPDEPVALEPVEESIEEPDEPEKLESVEIALDEPEEQPETLAFDEIPDEPELELPDIPALESNPDDQPIELDSPEEPVELVELVDETDSEPDLELDSESESESTELVALDEPVDSIEPAESPEPEQDAETMSPDEIHEAPESGAEPEPPALPVEETEAVAEVKEVPETKLEDAKESPEVPEEGFPLPDDPENDPIVEDGSLLDFEPSEESIGSRDDKPEGTQEPEPDSNSESESESESDDEKLEDFGEIEII